MVSLIWRVNLATMLFFTLVQLVVPLIPQYAWTINNDPIMIGVAVASISLTSILLRPVSGVISDRWSRSSLMILGLVLASLAYLILCLSNDIPHIILARLIEGAGVASFVPSSIASAVDQAPNGKLGATLGWRSMMIGIGFTIGPAVGGIIAYIVSYRTAFGIASSLLIFLIPLVVFRQTRTHSSPGSRTTQGLGERGFQIALAALIIYAIAWIGMLTFLSTYLKSAGYGSLEIGIFLFVQAVSSLALRVAAGKAADKRPGMMTYVGLLTISLSLVIVYFTQLPPYVYIAAPIFGIGAGIYVPGSQTLALMRAPTNSRGFLSSIYTMGLDVGTLVGPVAFGYIVQMTNSYQATFVLAPVLTFVAAVFVIAATRGYNH